MIATTTKPQTAPRIVPRNTVLLTFSGSLPGGFVVRAGRLLTLCPGVAHLGPRHALTGSRLVIPAPRRLCGVAGTGRTICCQGAGCGQDDTPFGTVVGIYLNT